MVVTIKDVAKLAGVSASTVSRTCSNHPGISEKTKLKVKKAMDELGYTPNFQASNLASKNSNTIGIVLPITEQHTYQNTFYLEVIYGVCEYCNLSNFMNTIVCGNTEDELYNNVLSVINSGKVDAFIFLYSKEKDKIISHLDKIEFPYVIIGKPVTNTNDIIYIDNDNITAGKDATNYLISLGHKNIIFAFNNKSLIFEQDRKLGYISALIENNIAVNSEFCIEGSNLNDINNKFIKKNNITAIVATDDILALKLEKIIYSLNLSIPNDISLICFNNSLITNLNNPRLTVVDINNFQLGYQGAEQIIRYIAEENKVATKIIVPHSIIHRESCKKID